MYYLSINKEHKDYLSGIRHWDNLKATVNEDLIWIKDFLPEQINATEMHQISFKTIYELKENLLFPLGSLLPSGKLPSALVWRPIRNVLPVELPGFNHNYFGVQQDIAISLKPSVTEREAFGLCVSREVFENYMNTAPDFRLKPLQWTMVDDTIIILGTPQLPLQGETLWMTHDFLVPTGMDFKHPGLTGIVQQKMNPQQENWILFHADSSYTVIPKNNVKQLSISSFRLTLS
jgi:hypothetical protein